MERNSFRLNWLKYTYFCLVLYLSAKILIQDLVKNYRSIIIRLMAHLTSDLKYSYMYEHFTVQYQEYTFFESSKLCFFLLNAFCKSMLSAIVFLSCWKTKWSTGHIHIVQAVSATSLSSCTVSMSPWWIKSINPCSGRRFCNKFRFNKISLGYRLVMSYKKTQIKRLNTERLKWKRLN